MHLTLPAVGGRISLTLLEMSSSSRGDVRVRVLVERDAWERIVDDGLFGRVAVLRPPSEDGGLVFPLRAVLYGRPASAGELLERLECGDGSALLGLRLVEALMPAPDLAGGPWEDVVVPIGDDLLDTVVALSKLGFDLRDPSTDHDGREGVVLIDDRGDELRVVLDDGHGAVAELSIDIGPVAPRRAELLELLNLVNRVLPVGAISCAADRTVVLRATASSDVADWGAGLAAAAAALVGEGRHLAGPIRSVAAGRLDVPAAWRVIGA